MKTICKIIFILFFANCHPIAIGLPFANLFANSNKLNSLRKVLQTTTHDTTRINTLNALAWELKYTNPDTAIYYSKQALTLAEKLILSGLPRAKLKGDEGAGWEKGIAKSHHNLGIFNWRKGNYPLAFNHYFKALSIREQLNDKKGIATTLNNIGLVYKAQGDYPKALEYYFKALKFDEELGNKSGIASDLGNIGIVYWNQGDYPKALEYYFKALKIAKELESKQLQANNLGNIGLVYSNQGDYPKALEYYFKALKIDKELGRKSGIATTLGNIGNVYKNQGEAQPNPSQREGLFNKALEYYFKALKIDEELGNKNGIARHLGNIGSLYTEQKKYPKAERYLLQALEICDSIGALSYKMQFENSISDLYEQTGQYQKAYKHHKEYSIAKDSLFNEEKSKDIGKLEARHEFEMAEQERKRKEEEQALIEAEEKSRRDNLQYSGILIFIVMIFAGVLVLGRFNVNLRLIEALTFISFLLVFETVLVFLDPYLEQWTGGEPAYKLAINAGLAGIIFPLHQFFETKMKKRMISAK